MIDGRGLSQRYGRTWVFRGLDLSVGHGVTVLLGPNGAGKTTLLHSVVGLRPPRAGSLKVLGVDVQRRGGWQAVAAEVGFLPQTVGFYPGYTLWDYVSYAAWLKGVRSRRLDSLVWAALERVDLAGRARSKMRTLSGGMIQRAGIAQAIVAEPQLVVLDEPSAGLDPAQRIELRRTIAALANEAAVFLSTHAVGDIDHIADTVLVLNDGEIAFNGAVGELSAASDAEVDGDTSLERGYMTILRRTVAGNPR